MKRNVVICVVILVLIVLFGTIALTGLRLGPVQIPSVSEGIRLGLDLVGGSRIVFAPVVPEGMTDAEVSQGMDIAETMLRKRLTSFNLTEAQLSKTSDNRLQVEIPGIDDPEEAVELLGRTARLEFRNADGEVVLYGSDVESAQAAYGPIEQNGSNIHYVTLTFKPEARAKFTEATKIAAQQPSEGKNKIAIVMDDEIQSEPVVDASYASTGINTDSAIISVGSADQARELAELINIGQLPFDLVQDELRSVGPQLGERSLESSLIAGFIGLGLIVIFMLVMYRVMGLVADIALAFYTALVAIILAVAQVNLSLPGIAGIILSIGMAVDANVVIFERIKEELRWGKTLRSAEDSGIKRALTAIIDSNITTIIAAVVLLIFGSGTIVGFALTLLIGVLVSMFTALFVTRFLLNGLIDLNVHKLSLYGVKVQNQQGGAK